MTDIARNFLSSKSAFFRYFFISSFQETRSTPIAQAQLDFSPFSRSFIISSTTTRGIFLPAPTVDRKFWVKCETLSVFPFVFLSFETRFLPLSSLSVSLPRISITVREKLIYFAISPISELEYGGSSHRKWTIFSTLWTIISEYRLIGEVKCV